MRVFSAAAAFLALTLSVAAVPAPTPPSPEKPPLDFSGTWELDERASLNISPRMSGAVLVVEQRGDHIRISPGAQGPGKLNLAADEVVADGQPYEKSVGGARGIATARWSPDGQALELTVTAGPTQGRGRALQTSRWTLSRDGSTWVRDTSTSADGKGSRSRLVFRRQSREAAGKTPTPASPKRK